jgi:hypothetical protein
MSFLETRLQGYTIIGMIFIFLTTYTSKTFNLSRNSCEYKLNSYSHSGNRKPRYYGYATYDEAKVAWDFFLETCVVPFSPLDGGVSATPVPPAQPVTPQRNRGRPLSYALRLSPTPAQHGSPNQASLASPPARSTVTSPSPPLYSQLAQSHSHSIQQTTETAFFVVMVGYNPGVFTSL